MINLKVNRNKTITLEFDNHILGINTLIMQLKSLKEEARYMMPQDEVFVKDYHALRITIDLLEQIKEITPNDN